MLPPSALQPGTSGLAWGATLEDCQRALSPEEISQDEEMTQVERWARYRLTLGGQPCYGDFWVADAGLRLLTVYLHVTTDFWHRKFGKPGPEMDEVLTNEAIPAYEAAVAEWTAILGPPTWSGINPRPRRPEQSGWYVTYWHIGDDQLQVQIHHEDAEFPYVVALASFPRVPMVIPADPLIAILAATDVQPYRAEWHGEVSADPAEVIRRFVGRPDLALVEEYGRWHLPYPTGNPHTDHFVTGDFRVDAEGYLLDAHMAPELVPLFGHMPAPEAPIDRPAALRAIEAFLAERVEGFDRLERYEEKTENRGEWSDGHPYELHQFTWYDRHGSHRALGITRVHASVDTVGSLVKFVQVPPTPVTVNVEPTITRDEVIAVALERYGKPTTAIDTTLYVWWSDSDDGSQMLRWIVALTGTEPWSNDSTRLKGASHFFDAHTGRFLQEYVSQDFPEPPPGDTANDAPQE